MSRPICEVCGEANPPFGFVKALIDGQPVHGYYCPTHRAAGEQLHHQVLGSAPQVEEPAASPSASTERPFDKPPPRQDGQGRLF